ncbi:MAG: NAD(P)-binding domain-containing protein [Chloroflexota bacterium]
MPPVLTHPTEAPLDGAAYLDRLVVASATFRVHDTVRREGLAATLGARVGGLADSVLLHTCHRVELISFGAAESVLADLPGKLETTSGLAAAERVMLVAGGLDSAVLAEEQVLGQVRDAYRSALSRGQTGPVINELLRRSIRFGKRVQSFAQPMGDRSLADRAMHWIEERTPSLSGQPVNALVVGTGEMGRVLAALLASGGARVTVASRNGDRASRLVAELPHPGRHQATSISDAFKGPLRHDVVAIAVRSGTALLESRHLHGHDLLVVDLSSPPAVTADAAAGLGERLLDLDRLGVAGEARRLSTDVEHRLRDEARAEAIGFAGWLEVRASGDAIAMLRAHGEEVRRRHLDRLRLKSRLDEAQAAAIEAMTVAMFGELLHRPTLQLRQGPDAAARVREVFGIE